MGCDIHEIIEKFNEKENKWEAIPGTIIDYNRNYDLFGILAGVRQRIEALPYITNPPARGVPPDASREFIDLVKHWDIDGHTPSYIYFNELLDYNWEAAQKIYDTEHPNWALAASFMSTVHKILNEQNCDPNTLRYCFIFDN